MPFNWAAAAAVGGAGASLGGSIISAANASAQNRKQRNFAREMYNLEKEDALAQWHRENEYGEYVWNKMNSYNSPMSQMARYKEAGLNPNLIYGQSNVSPAIQTGRYDAPRHHKPDQRPVDFGAGLTAAGQGLANYISYQQQSAQTDNIKAATEVARQDAVLRSLQSANVAADTAKKNIGLKYDEDLFRTSADAAKQNLENSIRTMQLAEYRDQREELSNVAFLRESAERILKSRGERVSQELDQTLKEIEINLRRRGVNPNDPMIYRIIGQMFSGTVDSIETKAKRLSRQIR